MCGGVQYTDKANKTWTIYFPNPKAALPVLKRNGEIEWVPWGKRKEEADDGFYQGGWARLDAIHAGKWAKLNAKPVMLPVQAFMEKDEVRQSHWITVPQGQVIQGLLAVQANQTRVYVVTTETPTEYAWVHDRWPRLVNRSQ